jgi:AraC-like DNA-binding protein
MALLLVNLLCGIRILSRGVSFPMQELSYHWQKGAALLPIVHAAFDDLQHHTQLPLAARREFYDHGVDTGLHRHEDFYALYVIQGGQGIHLINNHPYGIARGDIYMLPPGSTHAYSDYQLLVIDAFYFSPALFSDQELLALQSLPDLWRLFIKQSDTAQENGFNDHRLHMPPAHFHEVEAMITELHNEFVASTIEASILTRSLFFRLLVHLARWQASGSDRGTALHSISQITPHKVSVANILQICEERFHEPLTVPQLAALMFLSPSRFSEIFSREVGVSPAAYIRRLRLERAQTLLRTTSLSTTTIAHQVGFRDSAQLSRTFHAIFHLTPSAYRARFK